MPPPQVTHTAPPPARRHRIVDYADRCVNHLAALVAHLEGVGDEEMYEHALEAYADAKGVLFALTGRWE